ncbi:MAG: hypothetical protein FWE67_10245 [Planctomycetaceae bacterium]|nr:hypothetical protein [Planctomycetaceae bacterium]
MIVSADRTVEQIDSRNTDNEVLMLNSPQINGLSLPFVGTWNTLVSRTNWEKGDIILKWRNALIDSEQPKSAYSDEAWARRVGGVSPQHVGRLRRVSERFGEVYQKYPKLYWSHFFAALDWEDAETYLEGAVLEDWSAAQMRVQRWEVNGAPAELKPRDEDIFTAELEDTEASFSDTVESRPAKIQPTDNRAEGTDSSPPFDTDDDDTAETERKNTKSETGGKITEETNVCQTTGEVLAALNNFGDLPNDLREPLELLKVAVLNHKLSNWHEVSADSICRIFDTLKSLVNSRD